MRTGMRRMSIALVAFTLVAAACSSSDKESSGGGGGSSATTTPANPSDPAINKWAIDYTGGKPRKATGAPINIGYVNDDSFFPEASIGVNAAVAYANAELNGADGHEIVVKPCKVVTAEDGGKCGAQTANDSSINLVLTGTLLNGNQELYDALNGKKAVIIGNGVEPADFTTTAGEAFVAGAPGVLAGMANFAVSQFHPKKVALLANNNAAGQAGFSLIMKPIFDKAGATTKSVLVDDKADSSKVQSAMSAADVGEADVFVSIFTLQNCINMFDAMNALDYHPTVVTTGLCFGTQMTQHLKESSDEKGDFPDGWYFGGYGYSYYLPPTTPGMAESGMNTYLAKVKEYGKPVAGQPLEFSGFAGPMFGNVLTAVKFINQLGADKATVTALDGKIRSFTGPMMLQVGELKCGKLALNGITFPSVCGEEMGIQQYKDGGWISIADGHNGKPISLTSSG
jgi:hypothetical protein